MRQPLKSSKIHLLAWKNSLTNSILRRLPAAQQLIVDAIEHGLEVEINSLRKRINELGSGKEAALLTEELGHRDAQQKMDVLLSQAKLSSTANRERFNREKSLAEASSKQLLESDIRNLRTELWSLQSVINPANFRIAKIKSEREIHSSNLNKELERFLSQRANLVGRIKGLDSVNFIAFVKNIFKYK